MTPTGIGLELLFVAALLVILVGAFLVGRRMRAPGEPKPARRRTVLRDRVARLAARDRPTEGDWAALEEGLVAADAGRTAARRVVGRVRERYQSGQDPERLLIDEIAAAFGGDPAFALPADRLGVVMVVGINGTGKTTTIGKLARRLATEGRTVAVANSDTFRAAAGEQVEVWARRAGAEVVAAQERGGDPGAVAFDAVQAARARNRDVVIVDTAGRLHSKRPLMDELAKVRRVLEKASGRSPDDVLLVLDATSGQNGIAQAKAFTESAGVTGIVLTKMDGTARGGIVLAVREELGTPVKFVGTGEKLEDLQPFDAQAYATSLVRG
ncbi:MAG TPA: signal recognition particle-docking protein FtsY [Actinomycetota bacterium]|nr:signal recognition particle-docking protein FtsY [Actinomycetota bacterium]